MTSCIKAGTSFDGQKIEDQNTTYLSVNCNSSPIEFRNRVFLRRRSIYHTNRAYFVNKACSIIEKLGFF